MVYQHRQICCNMGAIMLTPTLLITTTILTIIIRTWLHPITRIPVIQTWCIAQMEACLMIGKFIQCWNQRSKVNRIHLLLLDLVFMLQIFWDYIKFLDIIMVYICRKHFEYGLVLCWRKCISERYEWELISYLSSATRLSDGRPLDRK